MMNPITPSAPNPGPISTGTPIAVNGLNNQKQQSAPTTSSKLNQPLDPRCPSAEQRLPKTKAVSQERIPCKICGTTLKDIAGMRNHNLNSLEHKVNKLLARQDWTVCPEPECFKIFYPRDAIKVKGHARSKHKSDVNFRDNPLTGTKELYFIPKTPANSNTK